MTWLQQAYANSLWIGFCRNECKDHSISYYLILLGFSLDWSSEVPIMKRSILVSLLALGFAAGCAEVSGTPATASSTPASSGLAYEPMSSPPPEPRKEDAPKLASKEVW